MKRIVFLLTTVLCLCSCSKKEPKISVFCAHIQTIAEQEGISFADAASRVKAMGYDGVDTWAFSSEQTMKTLDSLGFEHSCTVAFINFFDDNHTGSEDRALDFASTYKYGRMMVVPAGRGDSAIGEEAVLGRMADFIARANARGIDILFEDNDQLTSFVHCTADLEKVFAASPAAGHAFDTGNYLANGEDCLEAYRQFRDRIRHVHLKDRYSTGNMASCASFTGCIPMEELVRDLEKNGYDGYYAIEIFDSPHMLSDVETSIRNLKTILEGKQVPAPAKKDIGLQLYSVNQLESDFEGALDRIAGAGYTSVEISNYRLGQKIFGYDPAELKEVIEAHGLKLKSSNTMGADIDLENEAQCLENWRKVFADHQAMGCRYLALVGIFLWSDEQHAAKTCELLNKVGALANEYGIDFLYHNHNMEFHPLKDSELAPIDYMLKNTDPDKVNFELDVYWTMQGKRDPARIIREHGDRIHVLHIKDYYILGRSGKIDFEAVFKAFYENGRNDFFVEMEAEVPVEQADMMASAMYAISERAPWRPAAQDSAPVPEPQDPALLLEKSLQDVTRSCSFILSAPYVK